ncbi:MAG: chemotaxis protein CheX [Pirellulaceae bacterium]
MKVEYINPFLTSAIGTFETMLGWKLTRRPLHVKNGSQPEHEISGVIGLTGKAEGTVVLGIDRAAALKATEIMLQEAPLDINGDVIDAIGELTNIIAGGAKRHLESLELSVSLPMVICGHCHSIQFPSTVTPICIPFESDWGLITVEVGISESSVPKVESLATV